jgi:hypothetical protein
MSHDYSKLIDELSRGHRSRAILSKILEVCGDSVLDLSRRNIVLE